MNITDLLPHEKAVSTAMLLKTEQASATAIQILQGEQLKEHITKVHALLICIIGKVVFENEKGGKETLQPGDYINIDPMVKHWVNAIKDSQLILFK
jgi:quercetin dioxygenase-like cupin family protein